MNEKSRYYIDKLQLQLHPEGGYYNEIYRSGEMIFSDHLPNRYQSNRAFSTSIFFLLDGRDFSAFHRLKLDELWHFYDGSTVRISEITSDGKFNEIFLGKNLEQGEKFQATIRKDNWFAAELVDKTGFALVGCTVSPGFDFADFEMADCNNLIEKYPDYKSKIANLCKKS